jgi:hypothetical protein
MLYKNSEWKMTLLKNMNLWTATLQSRIFP